MSQHRDEPFTPIGSVRTSERVAEAIRRTILAGRFRPGEVLPPERTLAKRFDVTRNTVREALRVLETARLVSIRHGSGVRVRDYLNSTGLEFLAALFGSDAVDRQALLADVAVARTVLGMAMCAHAIDRVSLDALGAFEEAVADLEAESVKPVPNPATLQALDFSIHNRLVRAGGNRAFILLHNSLRHVYAQAAELFEALVRDPVQLAGLHRRAAEALRAGDRQSAKRAYREMFDTGQAALLGALEERDHG
jgi:DNA-binding FadR family transcriptional regulator